MIYWDVDPEIFNLGPLSIRYYGLLFALGFIIGFAIMNWMFTKENKPKKDLDDMLWYMLLGTVIGARLGHVLFYSPGYYLSNPIAILKVWEGGLASHGAAIGILIAIYLYSQKKKDQPYLWVMDRVVITVALAAFFIRIGNLMNSEIIGKPTDVAWAFIFARVDEIPRHPTQLYEALAYLTIFFILIFIYKKRNAVFPNGYIFGLFLILLFSFRIFVEFFKEDQSAFEAGMILNMGQILSIPLVLLGFYVFLKSRSRDVKNIK